MSAVGDAPAHLLEVEGLSAWYERDRPVLTDVSFTLEAGEAVGLIGLNGAGKTTMLTSLCDVHRGACFGALRYRGRLEELIEGFDYGRYRTTAFSRLSSGSRKKANLIAAFYLTTPLLFLDEPVDFLDFAATEFLYRSINDAAASGRSVLLSSHIAESFTRCTRRLYVLSAGRMTGPFSTPEDSDAVAALVS